MEENQVLENSTDNKAMAENPESEEQKAERYRRTIEQELLGGENVVEQTPEVDLRRMSRRELLTMLLDMKIREDKLIQALAEARMKADDRQIRIERAGSIAEAALELNGIFAAAQKAADDYLASIRLSNKHSEELLHSEQEQKDQE